MSRAPAQDNEGLDGEIKALAHQSRGERRMASVLGGFACRPAHAELPVESVSPPEPRPEPQNPLLHHGSSVRSPDRSASGTSLGTLHPLANSSLITPAIGPSDRRHRTLRMLQLPRDRESQQRQRNGSANRCGLLSRYTPYCNSISSSRESVNFQTDYSRDVPISFYALLSCNLDRDAQEIISSFIRRTRQSRR